ncbi:MAG: ATP-dependent DNA helicase RecQ [Gemmatimonadales bacterium]|nr:ATP-dependent DNA helicase RecQ [Gemmatimonadales bacterium]
MASPSPLDDALARLGHAAFRPGQREAITTLLDAGRLLLVAPTGGGKSLVYQLPALVLGGTTVVVSPLVALMQDQVAALEARGIAATYLAATLDGEEVRRRMRALAQGAFTLAYLAPERLAFPGIRALLRDLACPLLAIDEAHCISEWGHDFRPDYLALGELVAELPGARVLACTATATPVVRDEILARLGLPAGTPQAVHGFARPNLALRVHDAASGADVQRAVDAALAEALGAPGAGRGAAIVYAPTRRQSEEEGERLARKGWRAVVYHAGMPGDARDEAATRFRDGRAEVAVATNAFGMGIDRADVRAVLHLAPPSSLEAYYQEVGRAGRDGADAIGVLCIRPADIPLRRSLIERGAEGVAADPARVQHRWSLFLELLRWAEGGSCRHDAILRYFGDDAETLAGCGRCDVCTALGDEPDGVDEAEKATIVRKALSAVARLHGRFGLQMVVKLLAGQPDERLERGGFAATKTFGALRGRGEPWLLALLRRCVTAGWVDFTPDERPVVLLTRAGRAVLFAEGPVRLLLPRATAAARASGARQAPGARRDAGPPVRAEDAGLFERLRARRLELAREERVPPYVVASDRTLREIAELRPRTAAALEAVFGMGPKKVERYGAALLEAVRGDG